MAGKEQKIEWRVLRDYPEYKISNAGEVHERKSGLPLAKWKIEEEVFYRLRLSERDRELYRRQSTLLIEAFPTVVDI